MNKLIYIGLSIVGLIILLRISGTVYTVDESVQVVITQFGKPVGEPIKEAGLYFKTPFIQRANYFEKRLLVWDGAPNQIPTKDKRYIWVDTTARWKISDPLKYLQSVINETGAQARLDDIIDSATRDAITGHPLIEVVRNSNRVLPMLKAQETQEMQASEKVAEEIKVGREELTRGILKRASEMVPQYGIELVDVRIKRINYVEEVRKKVYDRMISERKRVAEEYLSEGQGKKAEIEGERGKEKQRIISQAYRKAQEIKGKADAQATKIYASAYNNDPEFYSFIKTLDTYATTIDKESTVILTTDSDYFEYLKEITEKGK
jgi:membrane protease subunit HflC